MDVSLVPPVREKGYFLQPLFKTCLSSRYVKVSIVLLIIVASVVILEATEHRLTAMMFAGGLLGAICSVIVMVDIHYTDGESSRKLLFWRAISDLGIALRFLTVRSLNKIVCHQSICSTADTEFESNCAFPSAFLEFFMIASEIWFLCVSVDLWIVVSNPFASQASWFYSYHFWVWSISLALSVPMLLNSDIHGFYQVSSKVDENVAICWMKNSESHTFWIYWMFYVPLALVYITAIVALVFGYRHLRHGISSTVIHRMKALVTNAINVIIYIIYWTMLGIFLLLAFTLQGGIGEFFFSLALFTIAGKGASALIVRILTVGISFVDEKQDDTERDHMRDSQRSSTTSHRNVVDVEQLDLNQALRQELLYFATSGIRNCADKGPELIRNQPKLSMRLQRAPELVASMEDLSPLFFLNLILGRQKEKQMIIELANSVRKKRIKPPTALEMAVNDDDYRNSLVTITSGFSASKSSNRSAISSKFPKTPSSANLEVPQVSAPSEVEEGRLSQRPTISMHVHGKGSVELHTNIHSDLVRDGGKSILSDVNPGPISEARAYQSEFGRQSEVVATDQFDLEDEADLRTRFTNSVKSLFFSLSNSSGEVEFVEVEPYHFRRIRISQRIFDEEYNWQFKTTIKERVAAGGASGALFFFSRSEMFMAKSCTVQEFATLTRNAKGYADYFESTKGVNSFISKVYGAYKMILNSFTVYFFVMNNIFYSKDENNESLVVHEKYDLKGSTVNRSSAPPVEGQVCTCKNCAQKFIYTRSIMRRPVLRNPFSLTNLSGEHTQANQSRSGLLTSTGSNQNSNSDFRSLSSHDSYIMQYTKCSATVSGKHEPNVVMKDNDLKYKIKLPKQVSREVLIQMEWDADFLYSLGIMDYSLLVGVHNTEYAVRGDGTSYSELSPLLSEDMKQSFSSNARVSTGSNSLGSGSVLKSAKSSKSKISFQKELLEPLEDNENPLSDLSMNDSFDVKAPVHLLSGSGTSTSATVTGTGTSSVLSRDTIHSDISFANPAAARFRRLEVCRVVGPDSYQMGIIDFQQEWNLNKQLERFIKVYFYGSDPFGLSAVDPALYRDRFVNHLRDILEVDFDYSGERKSTAPLKDISHLNI